MYEEENVNPTTTEANNSDDDFGTADIIDSDANSIETDTVETEINDGAEDHQEEEDDDDEDFELEPPEPEKKSPSELSERERKFITGQKANDISSIRFHNMMEKRRPKRAELADDGEMIVTQPKLSGKLVKSLVKGVKSYNKQLGLEEYNGLK